MFSWLNKQGVRSGDGFEVQRTGRYEVEYRERERIVSLDVEPGFDGQDPCLIISPNAFARWNDGNPIEAGAQAKMFSNLREAMEFQGMKVFIEDPRP